MASRRACWIVSAVLAALFVIPAPASTAAPVHGTWWGHETHWWDGSGGKWLRYSSSEQSHFKVRFAVKSRRAASFKAMTYGYACAATGEKIRIKPVVRKSRVYRSGGSYRFRGKALTTVSGRRYTASISGTFSSSRRAGGKLKSKLSGCGNSDLTKWEASKPRPQRTPTPPDGGTGDTFNPCIPYPFGGCWIR